MHSFRKERREAYHLKRFISSTNILNNLGGFEGKNHELDFASNNIYGDLKGETNKFFFKG